MFDGEGARLAGGRWSSPGIPLVYTAQSASHAALEMLVHLSRSSILSHYLLARCTFDETLVSNVDRSVLPANWRAYPAPPELQTIGNRWIFDATSAVLEVPSVIIDTESNYLLNPQHRDFGSIRFSKPEPFRLDARLI